MIFLPTRGRPDSIRRFMESYRKTDASEPVLLLVDNDDDSYAALDLHPHFRIMKMPEHGGISECFNIAFAAHPQEEAYGIMADDVLPETPHWDRLLKQACLPFSIAWGDDDMPSIGLPTHPFIAGDVARAIGWLAYPHTKHWFVDNVWKDIADMLGGRQLAHVRTPHLHILNNKAPLDDTYLNQPSRQADENAYNAFKENELPVLREKLASFKR